MIVKTIVKGKVKGIVLKTNSPINFLGAIDKKTGLIRYENHIHIHFIPHSIRFKCA